MTYETTNTDARVRAAREALRTHDELRRVEEIGDQFELGSDDLIITNTAGTERIEWGVRGPSGRIWTFPPPARTAATSRNVTPARSLQLLACR